MASGVLEDLMHEHSTVLSSFDSAMVLAFILVKDFGHPLHHYLSHSHRNDRTLQYALVITVCVAAMQQAFVVDKHREVLYFALSIALSTALEGVLESDSHSLWGRRFIMRVGIVSSFNVAVFVAFFALHDHDLAERLNHALGAVVLWLELIGPGSNWRDAMKEDVRLAHGETATAHGEDRRTLCVGDAPTTMF